MKWRVIAGSAIVRGAALGMAVGFALGFSVRLQDSAQHALQLATQWAGGGMWIGGIAGALVRHLSKPGPVPPDGPQTDYVDRDP